MLSSYTQEDKSTATDNGIYEPGNFIVSFVECDAPNRNCRDEMRPWLEKLHGLEI
jgi:hypothetical protein